MHSIYVLETREVVPSKNDYYLRKCLDKSSTQKCTHVHGGCEVSL